MDGKAEEEPIVELSASAVRRPRLDDVGRLPQRAGYPVPQPQLPQLFHQLGEELAQRREVEHPRLAVSIRHPPGLRGLGRAARLVADMADDGAGNARSIGRRGAAAAEVSIRAGGCIGGCIRRVLGHCDPSSSSSSSSRSESATAIAKPRARRMFPPAATTRGDPTTGATAIMTPWMSAAVTPASAATSALAR